MPLRPLPGRCAEPGLGQRPLLHLQPPHRFPAPAHPGLWPPVRVWENIWKTSGSCWSWRRGGRAWEGAIFMNLWGGGSGSGGRMRPSPVGSSRVPGEPPPPREPGGNIRPGGAGKDPANFSGSGGGRELAGEAAMAGPPCTARGPPGVQDSRLGVTAPCLWGRTPQLTRPYRAAVPHGMGLPPAPSPASSALALALSLQRPGLLGWCQQSYRWLKVHHVLQRWGPVCPQGCPGIASSTPILPSAPPKQVLGRQSAV